MPRSPSAPRRSSTSPRNRRPASVAVPPSCPASPRCWSRPAASEPTQAYAPGPVPASSSPKSAMPAATAAFVRVDLKPGYRDQIAFDGLAKKFPGRGESTTDLVTQIERKMLDGHRPGLRHRRGAVVRPARRHRGVADKSDHVIGSSHSPAPTTPRRSRRWARSRPRAPGQLRFRGSGWLRADRGRRHRPAGEPRTRPPQAAATANLADDKAFHASVSHLPGNNLVIGYGDLGKVGPLAGNALSRVHWPPAVSTGSAAPTGCRAGPRSAAWRPGTPPTLWRS